MKKLNFTMTLLVSSVAFSSLLAQNETYPKNELRVNVGYALMNFPEISYERMLSKETSAGLSVAIAMDGGDDSFFIEMLASPFYRLYFGNQPVAKFFFETNGAVYNEEAYYYNHNNGYDTKNKLGLGLGIGVGGKFTTSKGVAVELLAGIGRNFLNENKISGSYPRLGVSVGKQF